MVSQTLPIQTQGNLRRQGYRLETTHGWDTHEILLYPHKKTNIAVLRMRVGNLKHMDRAEAQYVANKGSRGFFMWKPDECMEHEFTEVEIKSRPGGGVMEVRSPDRVFGCKWCRDLSNNGLEGEVKESSLSTAESAAETFSTPPTITTTGSADGVKCSLCNVVMKTIAVSGKPRSEKQQLHALKLHTNRKHA